jgi:probable addiction module antidote protein
MTTKAWDPSDHLVSPKTVAAYLDAAFDDGDPTLIAAAIGDIARAMNMPQLAEQPGVTREAVKALIERESARRLASLGGTMPELSNTPRRR